MAQSGAIHEIVTIVEENHIANGFPELHSPSLKIGCLSILNKEIA